MHVYHEPLDKEICMDLKLSDWDYTNLGEYIPIQTQTIIDGKILNICLSLKMNEDDYEYF